MEAHLGVGAGPSGGLGARAVLTYVWELPQDHAWGGNAWQNDSWCQDGWSGWSSSGPGWTEALIPGAAAAGRAYRDRLGRLDAHLHRHPGHLQ